jgi:hypothetical protein
MSSTPARATIGSSIAALDFLKEVEKDKAATIADTCQEDQMTKQLQFQLIGENGPC